MQPLFLANRLDNSTMKVLKSICYIVTFLAVISCKPSTSSSHEDSIIRLKALAEAGDPRAQTQLGAWYVEGKEIPKNAVEGVKWLRRAAEQGDSNAQYDL